MKKLAFWASWAVVCGMSVAAWSDEAPAKPAAATVPAVRVVPATAVEGTAAAKTGASQNSAAAQFTGALFRALGTALGSGAEPAPTVTIQATPGPQAPQVDPPEATHKMAKTVKVTGERGATLQTLAATPEGQVVCLLGPSRYAPVGQSGGANDPQSEVRVFDGAGNELRRWPVAFTGQSVAVGPRGEIFVAGDGRVARFSHEGKLDVEVEVPHIVEMLKDNETLEKQAREQIQSNVESYEETLKTLKSQLEEIEKSAGQEPGGKASNDRKQERALLKSQISAYENALQQIKKQDLKETARGITSRMRIINGLAVTDKEVYVMCGETKGYGYSLWRMDLALSKSEKVLSRLSGCCGQMDVQARGDQIVIAENTRHRVARYGRDGTLVDSFGARARESVGSKFGGCCNPMNCRIMDNGDVYTAESEGVIKKFNSQGEFVALVGVAKLTGGCKNVAVAAAPKGDRVFFCDQPGSQFVILEQKPVDDAAAGGGK